MSVPRLLVGLVLALALAGCQGDRSGAEPGPGAPTTTAGQPAPDPVGGAPGCTAATTKAVVKGFFAALSAGRVTDLDEFFAPASRFKWYANAV